jgi:hypothetical protein
MRAKLTVLMIATLATSAGCGAVPDEIYYAGKAQQETLNDLLRRAEVELGCKSDNLDLAILERARHGDPNSPPTIVGFNGCGQRAAYQREVEVGETEDVRAMRNTPWVRTM